MIISLKYKKQNNVEIIAYNKAKIIKLFRKGKVVLW